MKLLIALAMSAVLVSGFASVSLAGEPEIKDGRVFCGDVPGKGYKCSDGTVDEGHDGLVFDDKPFDATVNGTAEVILTLTAKIDTSECRVLRAGLNGDDVECQPTVRPEIDYVTAASRDDCRLLGRTLAWRKWKTLSGLGIRARIVWQCD